MRVLWLSVTSGLYQSGVKESYNGGGWIASLQSLVIKDPMIQLGLVFPTYQTLDISEQDGIKYYPVRIKHISSFEKIKYYYGRYRRVDDAKYVAELLQIIQDFKPDIIHLFGMENAFATILGKTGVPIVVHLQGLLSPCDNAFFPVGFNERSFLWPISKREYLFRNGLIFAKKNMYIRAEYEKRLFKRVHYLMGRTGWDFQISNLLAPDSKYFHVDEVLRSVFYENAGRWSVSSNSKLAIVSTLSETVYKGLDLILKAASLLKENSNIDFCWNIVGIKADTEFTRRFEKLTRIDSSHVGINYVGVQSAEQIKELLLKSDVYVHPSYIDNSPNSVCEAQLIGIPVIACNVGGVGSLLQNNSGILIPANAPFELAYHLRTLANNKDLLVELSEKGKKEAFHRHDKVKIKQDLVNTYNQIINES